MGGVRVVVEEPHPDPTTPLRFGYASRSPIRGGGRPAGQAGLADGVRAGFASWWSVVRVGRSCRRMSLAIDKVVGPRVG